jgi:PAS domain S-box-containing protein
VALDPLRQSGTVRLSGELAMRRQQREGPGSGPPQRLDAIGLHDHACLVLESEEDRLRIACSYLQIGLQRGERCVYVADEDKAGSVIPCLRAAGVHPGRALASGALVITTDGGICPRPGAQDPSEVFFSLEGQVEAALGEGFRALRIMGDATWALGRCTRIERLLEFEDRLKRTFRDQAIVGLWLYDPWRCPPGLLPLLLRMHPLAIVRGEVVRNCLYVPAPRPADGRTRGEEWRGTLDVIAERARVEEALERRVEQLQVALEGGAHALWGWDLGGGGITLDPQFAGLPGIEPSRVALTLAEWEQLLHPDELASFWKAARDAIEGRAPRLEHECRMKGRSGSWRWVQLRAKAVQWDASGRPLRIAGTATDVSELRAARERRFASHQLELAGWLASAMAREIDRPLDQVISQLGSTEELLQRFAAGGAPGAEAARVAEILKEAQRGADRLRGVAGELPGALRHFVDGKVVPCDVREELCRAVSRARRAVDGQARMSASLVEPLPRVLFQDGALGEVFLNLLLEAAHVLPEGSPEENEVRLMASARGEHVIVEVTGDGFGPGLHLAEHGLDSSFSAQARKAGGMGVGLPVCRALLEKCGGRIEVSSESARGTTLRVVLPAMSEAEAEEPESRERPSAETRRRVLVIDGEEFVARSFSRILEADHDVTVLSSPEEALRCAQAGESWDVILCDLHMGELDGMEFYERLNSMRPDLGTCLGFITRGPWPPEVRSFLAGSAWPIIEKPLVPDDVRAVVGRMAPRRPAHAHA